MIKKESKRNIILVFFILSLFSIQSMGFAYAVPTILLTSGSAWEYTFTNPTGDPTWNTSTGIGILFPSSGNAPFGNQIGPFAPDVAGHFSRVTVWPADGSDGDDLWVRRTLDLSCVDLTTVRWDLGVDNGFKLYLNGALVSSANAEGYTSRWEYSGDFGAVPVNPGVNYIAVALEDHGGLTAFDMQVTGDLVVCDPVGGTLLSIDNTALLLAGIQNSTVWMLPALVGIAGAGAYYIRIRMNKE